MKTLNILVLTALTITLLTSCATYPPQTTTVVQTYPNGQQIVYGYPEYPPIYQPICYPVIWLFPFGWYGNPYYHHYYGHYYGRMEFRGHR